ncbi:anti-sigma factor [Aureitalea sp. L0-47]|uniref:anti-sigma factor n=1 Tax=Aureitalea sp. L0-47 TaxID=2816962 RepID=UPI002238A275|nr:anti-sigma factor [Aureitalea sp. L0-47]MCW5519625.1 anti-sigma factor [Aureitalea sp. L0-47]
MKENYDIIESGMLERYLLGELSKDEVIEIEAALSRDSSLRAQLDQLEQDLETMAIENALTPPENVKQAVFRELQMNSDEKIIKIKPLKPVRTYTAIAASIAALFMLSSFWLYQKMNGIQEDLRVVKEQNNLLLEEKDNLQKDIEATNKWLSAVNSAETEKLIMKGNDLLPEATAISYVNHSEKTVILNASGLPELPADKDYQLWADVEGEMIDMGVIPKKSEMIVMTYIEDAESLNITIEPAGGNDHPTVSNLISFVSI